MTVRVTPVHASPRPYEMAIDLYVGNADDRDGRLVMYVPGLGRLDLTEHADKIEEQIAKLRAQSP